MDTYNMLSFILGLPKTIYVNFRYFKFRDAIKLPIWISKNVLLKETNGKIIINTKLKTGLIKFGFGKVDIFDRYNKRSIFINVGEITFNGKANLGHGTKLSVQGELIIGKNFVITAESSIICYKKIAIGDDCLISWENLIMDTDFHNIKDNNGNILNENKEIIVGNNVWIGCRNTILKGSKISNNSVVAANSVISNVFFEENVIIGGNPSKILKENIIWEK